MDNTPHTPNNQYQKLEGFFWMSLRHPYRVFVGKTSQFLDSAKPAPWGFWLLNLTTLCLQPFFTDNLVFWPLFLRISGEGSHCFSGVPLFLQFRQNALSTHNNSWILEVLIFLLCLGMSLSVTFYAEIWRSMLLNLGHNEHVFPSLPLPFRNKLESSLSKAISSPESQPDHTSALGVNFHHSFSINLSIAPWAVYVPCYLHEWPKEVPVTHQLYKE
jgi:hypothetical protein